MNVKRIVMGAVAVSVVALGARGAQAAPNPGFAATTPEAKCSDALQNETLKYAGAIQKLIRLSIKNNVSGKDSACSGGFACAGGANNGKACTANADCGAAGPADPQCLVSQKKGGSSSVLKAKAGLRAHVASKCTDPNIVSLGFGAAGTKCAGKTTVTGVLDCILEGAAGGIATGAVSDPVGEIMGRAANGKVADGLLVAGTSEACALSLGSDLQVGRTNFNPPSVAEAGGATPSTVASGSGGVYQLEGKGIVGNILTVTSNPGAVPTCLVTSTTGVPPSFLLPGVGTIDLSGPNVGLQTSNAPIQTIVYTTGECPKCLASTGQCDAANTPAPAAGAAPCNNKGDDDPICAPAFGSEPVIPNPLNLTTETVTLTAPSNGPGIVNPAQAMCGACDGLGAGIGCQSDADCAAQGFTTCTFAGSKGAFGDTTATSVSSQGARGPYVAKLAGAFCTGKTGTGLDSLVGLPGPVRITQMQLNQFIY